MKTAGKRGMSRHRLETRQKMVFPVWKNAHGICTWHLFTASCQYGSRAFVQVNYVCLPFHHSLKMIKIELWMKTEKKLNMKPR